MSYKRSRASFEADQQAPYAVFGTPLPDDTETRDDGTYLPLWKQEVRDERGRKRLHGAFTGGWSAGYFNTVGSKEGWTPSTFVSSRTNRHKDDAAKAQQRPEDYMDEEDRQDAAEAQNLQTSHAFAGLGSTAQGLPHSDPMGLLRATGDTMGLKLLRRMGWKDGQGIGPKVRRRARLDLKGGPETAASTNETYLFAPENVAMVQFTRKSDRKGMGYQGEKRIAAIGRGDVEDDNDQSPDESERKGTSLLALRKSKPKHSGIGVGILNDNGSDEEDPYEIGPKIRYNRVIGGDKKKKKKKPAAAANPSLGSAPVFLRKSKLGSNLRRCHDGRLPLNGFVLASFVEDLSNRLTQYAPPSVPPGWASKKSASATETKKHLSTADAAKQSSLDAKSRAAILGEQALPGKSVFDYLSAATRDKLATASGKTNLPPARGEAPMDPAQDRLRMLVEQIPKLDRDAAVAAISRSSIGPYADDAAKRNRYRAYLESQAKPDQCLPNKPTGVKEEDFIREMNEFYNCARIFKPMTGFMASRFTTAKTTSGTAPKDAGGELLSRPELKVASAAEEAAKMGMFGHMTRSTQDFFPTRLLCKRFNVKPPAHARADNEADDAFGAVKADDHAYMVAAARPKMEDTPQEQADRFLDELDFSGPQQGAGQGPEKNEVLDPDRNEAVEGKTAHAEVLRAIFGDSDSE